jgi:dTDP-4-dehydrorhamnose reductase
MEILATFHDKMPRGEGCSFTRIDIAEKDQVVSMLKDYAPQAVVHTAGAANVDFCQKHPEVGFRNNVDATQNVVQACGELGIKMVHVSTNAVYKGDDPPYGEQSPKEPVNVYGQLKKQCDDLVKSSGLTWTIIRPILMYGWSRPWSRKDFVVWILENLRSGKPVSLVTDIRENPLSAELCARAIWKCLENDITGEYNLAGRDTVSRCELGAQVAEVFELDASLVLPVRNTSFKNIAPRPANTSFDTSKMSNILKMEAQPLREGLERMRYSMPDTMDLLIKGRLAN